METNFLKRISYEEFTNIAINANDELIVSMPNLHEEFCETIMSCHDKQVNITVIIDNREDNYRNGYGEIKSISRMKEKGIRIFNLKDNFVSFIISDKNGYYIFPQSRIFTADDTVGLNAVAINPLDILLLKKCFLGNLNKEDSFETDLLKSITKSKEFVYEIIENIESSEPIQLNELKKEEISDVREKLNVNPPLQPDLKRKLTVYTAKVQYVEFSFEGAHLNSSKINIPPNALPFKDANLKKKLETKMMLFGDGNDLNKFGDLKSYNASIDKLRKDYLTPLSSRKGKSIIKVERKNDFIIEFKMLEKKLISLTKKLKSFLQNEILNSEEQIKLQLLEFFKENIPDNLKDYSGILLEKSIHREVIKIISKITFPVPDNILNNMKLIVRFYDLTYEDFKDVKLLIEFEEKEIMEKKDIKDIVEFSRAIAVKKNI